MKVQADELLHEYGIHKKDLERRRERLDRNDFDSKQDLTRINSMIESMNFSMEWLETGRQPGTFKASTRRASTSINPYRIWILSLTLPNSWKKVRSNCI